MNSEPVNNEVVELFRESMNRMRSLRAERSAAALLGVAAMLRLVDVMTHKTGQGYKLRELIFSMWNGKPARLNEVLSLDWELRKDFATVVLSWGFEDKEVRFFYKAVEEAVKAAGLWDWFLAERFEIDALDSYVQAARGEGAL